MIRPASLYEPISAELEACAQYLRQELQSDYAFIADLYHHVEHFHGKQIRPALLLLSGRACGKLRPEHPLLAAVVEMVHLATLVHDDVLDGADLRRRAQTVNRLWGNERAVLLGDLLFSHAYHLCSRAGSQSAAALIARTAVTVCEGEILQIANRDNLALSEQTYFEIVTRKTAALLGTCGLLGAACAGADEQTAARMEAFGQALGVAFQIVDDLLDLEGDETETGKSLGLDMQKGKLTLPLIHFLRTAAAPRRAEMLALLGGPRGPAQRRAVVRLLRDSDSAEYAATVAAQHVSRARALLEELPSSDARTSLAAIADFVLARRY